MSEGSKMGLFGSKDDKKESTSDDTTKPNTPDRYAPYCIDSDSETYDTEALSIMDINDIIGVQTGQAVESTLESEIAALTEVITDSKDETNSAMMKEIHGESSDIKFNEELLTEFTSLSSSENPIPTTTKDSLDQRLTTSESEIENVDKQASDKSIAENTTSIVNECADSASKKMSEIEADIKILGKVTVEARNVAIGSVELNNELIETKAETESEDTTKKESSPSSPAKNFDDIVQKDEVLATVEDKLPIKTDTVSQISNSETETIGESIVQVATDLLEETSEAVGISLDERTEDNKDSSKCIDVPIIPVEDTVENNSNLVEDVDSVIKTKSEGDETIDDDDPKAGKLTDVLTNVGSTSKSLQLIGEAYISEDSQETDEKDELPVKKVAFISLHTVEKQQTVEIDNKPQEKCDSDVLSDTLIDELKINEVEKSDSDNQDNMSLEDNKEPDNTKEVLPNLKDNCENCSQDSNADLQINVQSEDDQVINEDKSVEANLRKDINIDNSNELVEVTSVPTISIVPGTSSTPNTTSMKELLETKEESLQKTEHSEDIQLNSRAETVGMTTEDKVYESETTENAEKVGEKISDEEKLQDETMEKSETDVKTSDVNNKPALEVDKFSTGDPQPSKRPEALPSVLAADLNTESDNTIEVDSQIHIENAKVTKSIELSEFIDESNEADASESNVGKELIDSQSNKKSEELSLLSLRHSFIEDKFAERDSESSILPVEVDTNSGDKDNQPATISKFAEETICTEEENRETSKNVEQLLESVQENTQEFIVNSSIMEKDIPFVIKVTDDELTENNYEGSITEAEKKIDSTPSDGASQLVSMEITSPIVQANCSTDRSNSMLKSKGDLGIEESKENIDEVENLGTELIQSESTSCEENKVPPEDIVEASEEEETESLEPSNDVEKLSSGVVKADSLNSGIVEENLSAEGDNSTEIETVKLSEAKSSESQVSIEQDIDSQSSASEPEILNSITTEVVPESTTETILENIPTANVEVRNLEIIEHNSSANNLDKMEIIENSGECQEIGKAEIADSEQQVESGILRTDEAEVSKTKVCNRTQQLEENKSISELSIDTEDKLIKDTDDGGNIEIKKSESITEPSTEMVCDNTATVGESETASEVSTMQDPLESDSHSQSQPKQEKDEGKLEIQAIQHQGESLDVSANPQELDGQSESTRKIDESQFQKLSHSNSECSSSDEKHGTKSEILSKLTVDEKEHSSQSQIAKSGKKANLVESLHSVPSEEFMDDSRTTENENKKNLPENQEEKASSLRIEAKEFQEIESKLTVSENISKFSEKVEELQDEKLIPTTPVDVENLGDIISIHSAGEMLESNQTPSSKNEVEYNSEAILLPLKDETVSMALRSDNLIESEVKVDEDLQCEPIEELEKLAVVTSEILIDELADSVLKDTVQPLEIISNLETLPDSDLSISTILSTDEIKSATVLSESSEIKDQPVSLLGEVNETCFIEDLNQMPSISHGANYVTDVIISSTNIDNIQLADNMEDMGNENVAADKFDQRNQREAAKTSGNLISKDSTTIDESITSISESCQLEIETNLILDKNIEIDLPLKQEEEKLIESAVLRACDANIILPDEVLFDAENTEQTDVLCSTRVDNIHTSQQSSEFSELECAVKFLQESEEQTIDSPLLLSPKITEEIAEDNSEQSKSCNFLSETEVCQETLELPVELEEITPDSIAISEAEIISEAAKLENERKLKIAAEMSKSSVSIEKLDDNEKIPVENTSELLKSLLTTSEGPIWQEKLGENVASTSEKSEDTEISKLFCNIIRRSEKIPKISLLEERLKEPPKIEIPVPEVSPKISDAPTTPKTSLLIQRDSRMDTKMTYQKMLESPKGGDKGEPKIVDTPRKDSDKHDFENVGSPRIILKIAKSAIADCGEPRSPKSPKIRSAANSPNPEDSPGQKLGKIKLKLSKGGHPSIISNENFDETAQRHMEPILSPSHIGMKIKLSKTGDASIIQSEKHDSFDDIKESKHKFGEASPKRIDSPLGMKIKLSKTGDPSIVQQDSKDSTSKRKEKLDIGQEIPKRTDSPIGMKIKLSKSGDASIIQPEKQDTLDGITYRDKFDITTEIPKRTESPIGMKIKLSKTGDASIISSEGCEEFKDSPSKSRDKLSTNQDIPKRTDSPLGMKFKLSKSGGASIIQPDKPEAFEDFKDKSENIADITKRLESPLGMKIKLLKTGDASIIHPEKQEPDEHKESIVMKHRDKSETLEIQKRTDSPLGMRIKVTKTGEASVVPPEEFKESSLINTESYDITHEIPKRNESPIGMKIKLSKSGDASIIHPDKQEFFDESKDPSSRGSSCATQEGSKSTESSLGMKIKLSKTGDASIIHPEISPESEDSQLKRTEKLQSSGEGSKRTDSPLGMRIKLSKTGDASIIEPDKKEKTTTKQKERMTNIPETSQKRKEMEYPLEMKIKLSKTGHPTIIANEKQESFAEMHSKSKDHSESGQSTHHIHAESMSPAKDSQLRIFKSGHSTIIQSSRSEVTIEPIQIHHEQPERSLDISPKSKDVIISPVDLKKSKLEAKLSHILPEVTIQPVTSGEQKQIILDKKSNTISRQQMSVINQEISITQVSPPKPTDLSMSGKLKEILRKNATNSPANSDCEIIEHRPELIIVNENSNSSQDIMIIEEVKAPPQEVKVPRKRGRPKRSSLPPGQPLMRQPIPRDPLALDNMQSSVAAEHRESDRPKRTCRNQKSYAPPKRGRGRGRGKRKMDRIDCAIGKIPRLEDPLTAIERSTMSLIAPLQPRMLPEATAQTSELYKALRQSPAERKKLISENLVKHGFPDAQKKSRLESESGNQLASNLSAVPQTGEHSIAKTNVDTSDSKAVMISEMLQFAEPVTAQQSSEKLTEVSRPGVQETKNIITDMTTTEPQNWLTPSIKLPETSGKTEAISMVQVMDEETRMSAESNSRSQTPARNISMPAVETVINEESQGSVLSTATTESEKVKVRNRRMEINFDPDEGPFTVDKIAEYEWPLDRKGETFMIQEQISQYLGVKSFKRKYPDLKRRMVEMEERNYLRENCLVSEGMCDMGLTAICSTEVLDIMCSDFPDQYEEYRKHMREKQAKEHSKKQKELTAAANAERNRIDLAEMAVQSALSWNVNFNKARKESRKYSLDLQSFTIHVPKKQLKVDAERKASNYPVALIPGQYTDYYREYTPAELRYYPLNTVLYGPMRPNERKFDSQSEGSQSDSDSDSSSDDSSSSSSEGTQDTEESQSTVDDVDMELAAHKEDNKNLKCKMCLKHLNKHGKAEVLIQCGTCNGNVHPSCIDLTLDMVPHIQGYSWQCTDCKTCVQCHNPADEDKMLFCDMCDRGYHIYCVGLRRVPQGRWHCRECAVCASCGLRQPGGANSDRNSVAQWQHEYKKGERNTRVYVSTLCVPCSKLWRKGRYCPHCSRCHSAQRLDLEPNLVHCGACDKYLHLGCVEIRSGTLDRKNYICDWCSTPNQLSRSLMSKNYKT